MTKLGVGIIGCGNISAAYLRLGKMFKALDLRAVADIDMAAAQARADEFGVRADNVEDLLAADDIDVVVNLTIPEAHFDVTRRILRAGKHAYSEKPFVLTLEQGEELRALSAEKGLRVGSTPDTFLGGAHQQARNIVDAGSIGRVVAGTAHVMSCGMEHWHPNPDFFFLPGAGPMLDVGPYYVTNLLNLLGPVKRVAALANSASDARTITTPGPRQGEKIPVRTPTNIHALLEFEQGALVTMSASWDVRAHGHGPMELYGTEGSMFLPDPNFFGGALRTATRDGTMADVAAWDHPFGVPNEDHGDVKQANYRASGLAEMVEAIVDDRPHRCSLELALHAVDVMTAILESGETGTFIDLTTTCEKPAPLTAEDAEGMLA